MGTLAVENALNAPPAEVGPLLASLPEDQWLERKSCRIAPRDLAKVLIGFANADGGTLVVGLENGEVEGTDGSAERRNSQLQANVDFCTPPVPARHRLVACVDRKGEPNDLVVFQVEPSESVHANKKDEVFLRVGDENRKLGFAQRQELLFDKGQASYEARPSGAPLDLVDRSLLDGYARWAGSSDPARLLQARGLANDGELTIAGCLLFSEAPQAFLPEAFIRVLRYQGRERGSGARQQLVDDIRLEGPIPAQLRQAREQVERLQPTRRALSEGGTFEDVPLVPDDAWLEGIVNAAVHRSYSMAGDHIRVEIFDDRIEISSPGRFPGLVDLEDPLQTMRFARNPRIARVCADLSLGQELGEGIRRMFEEMRQAGLTDPVYRQTSGSVELQLLAEPVDRRLEARLPAHSRAIARTLRSVGRMSTGEVTEALGLSRPVVQKELSALREAGIVEWVGKSPKDPRAYWQLRTR
ncbi:MAG TPA: ATP-binding protein [Solirubrobacterales bacterium]|nr:ATP-binding protein [Solirubrobacterales bacterium]